MLRSESIPANNFDEIMIMSEIRRKRTPVNDSLHRRPTDHDCARRIQFQNVFAAR